MSQRIERFETSFSLLKWMAWQNNGQEISDFTVRSTFKVEILECAFRALQPYWHFKDSLETCIYSTAISICCWMSNTFLKFQLFVLVLNVLDVNLPHTSLSHSLCLIYCLTTQHNTQQCPHDIWSHLRVSLFSFGCSSQCVCETNYVTFVLVVRHTLFFPLLYADLSFPSGCENCSARTVQLAPKVRTGLGYTPAHWLKWKNKAFGQATVGCEWSSNCSKHTK